MSGYDENFLTTPIPLPGFAMHLEGHVLRHDALRDGVYRDYINYSLVMNKSKRTPILAALNIDQTRFHSVKRGGWNVDTVIGAENQLDNDYYYNNRWDRGHVARRSSAAHGPDSRAAKRASDSTMFFTNACLQFDSFNQDEWLDLEDWVKDLKDDGDDRITVFSGPISGDQPLHVVPKYRDPAEVPAAFFKVVCFMNHDKQLEVRAFNVPQDQRAMADWQGRHRVNRQTYQTTVAEIEHLTGIEFPPMVAAQNPLLYYASPENEAVKDTLRIDSFPENIPVDRPSDLTAANDARPVIISDKVDVFIAGALPNPEGPDAGKEWVSIINLENQTIDLAGWELSDNQAKVTLSGKLRPGASKQISGKALGPLKLSNKADILTLKDDQGRRIDRVRWTSDEDSGAQAMRPQSGKALVFQALAPMSSTASRYPQSEPKTLPDN